MLGCPARCVRCDSRDRLSIVSGAVANRQGDFALGLPPGSYFVYLIDPSGARVANFHGPPTTVGIEWSVVTATL